MKIIGKAADGHPIYETKDAGGGTTDLETHEQVVAEVKKMGGNVRTIHDTVMSEVKQIHDLLSKSDGKLDALAEQKFQKLSESVLTKQEQLDKLLIEQKGKVDDLALAFQRMGKFGDDSTDSEFKAKLEQGAREMKMQMLSLKGQFKPEDVVELSVSKEEVEHYAGYCKVFSKWMRTDEKKRDMVMTDLEKKMLSVGVEPDGGLLVPPTVSARIIERIFETDPLRALATVESIGTDRLELMEDLDEAGDGWETETVATNETGTPRLNKVTIPVHWQSARPRATQQMLDDASMNVEQWLSRKVSDKMGRTEAAAFVTGTGIGRPRGILTYSNWTAAGTFEFGKVEQVNMGAAAAITTNGLLDVLFALVEPYSSRASWLMNRLTVRDIMKLKDGDGQYIWRPGLTAGQPATLLGLPIYRATTMPVIAANALSVALGDWAAAYTIVDRMGISVQRDPFTVKPLVEFYTRRRVGGGVTNFEAFKIGKVAV